MENKPFPGERAIGSAPEVSQITQEAHYHHHTHHCLGPTYSTQVFQKLPFLTLHWQLGCNQRVKKQYLLRKSSSSKQTSKTKEDWCAALNTS
jgi:hypothetical protein